MNKTNLKNKVTKNLPSSTELPNDSQSSSIDKSLLVSLYQSASNQNSLYADFRWRVVSYISTLHAGLFYVATQASSEYRLLLYSIVGMLISLLLWFLEKRHSDLFDQSRLSGLKIEKLMGAEDYGVFNEQIKNKKKAVTHHKLIAILTIITSLGWSATFIWALYCLLQ